jgi:hypothetical protein
LPLAYIGYAGKAACGGKRELGMLWFRGLHYCLYLALSILLCSPLLGETHPPATITFNLDFPGADPTHFAVSVSSDAKASYDSRTDKTSDDVAVDTFHLDFQVSNQTRDRIFELAGKADYFAKALDSGKDKIAFTGTKILTYKDAGKDTRATYNYSTIPAVQMLTGIFQNLSNTLECGRRLDFDYRYQKLALEAELKRMETMQKEGDLQDLQAIAPILQKIANDPSLINVSRARAGRLIAETGK